MSFINSCVVYIDGINRTNQAVLPLKFGNILDERLDECNLSLRRIPKQSFLPLTPVEIVIVQKEFETTGSVESANEVSEEKIVEQFLIANDSARENPVGSGYYDHELLLIEPTKYAECVVSDTLTYTNDLGKNYTANATPVEPEES